MTPFHCSVFRFLKKHSGIFVLCFFAPMSLCFGQQPPDLNPSCPDTILVSNQDQTCSNTADGAITLTVLNAQGEDITSNDLLRYRWSHNPDINSPQISGLDAGEYSVTVLHEEFQLCSLSVENIQVKKPVPLAINCFVLNDVSVFGGQDGVAKVDCSQGTLPYNIQWSGPVSGSILANAPGLNALNNLKAGLYFVRVSDACEVADTCSFTIREPEPCLEAYIRDVAKSLPSCFGMADGSATLFIPEAPAASFTYRWNDGVVITGNPVRSDLSSGSYQVTIEDAMGCRDSTGFDLPEPDVLKVECVRLQNDAGGESPTGEVLANATGGTYPYSYSLRTTWGEDILLFSNSASFSGLPADDYQIEVKDGNSCKSVCDIAVEEIAQPQDTFIMTTERMSQATYDSLSTVLMEKGARKLYSCGCIPHADSVIMAMEIWQAGDNIIEINNQGSKVRIKDDDSGLNGELKNSVQPALPNDPDKCIAPLNYVADKKYFVTVAVIDSGADLVKDTARIAGAMPTHPVNWGGHDMLKGLERIKQQEETKASDDDGNCLVDDRMGYDVLNHNGLIIENVGHATHVSGIIADNFPDSMQLRLLNIKIYDETCLARDANGNCNLFRPHGTPLDLACALHYAINEGADVINLSLGYFAEDAPKLLYEVLKRAERENIIVVVSSGNEGINLDQKSDEYPGYRWPLFFQKPLAPNQKSAHPPLNNLIVVAALDSLAPAVTDKTATKLAGYSNFSANIIDVAAKGVATSAHWNNTYKTLQGTSMSAAYVTRIAAMAKAYTHGSLSAALFAQQASHTSASFSDAEQKLKGDAGEINESRLLDSLGVPVPPLKPNIEKRLRSAHLSSLQFTPEEKLTITLGDRVSLYQDIEVVVKDQDNDKGNVLYNSYYCLASKIVWDGRGNNGLPLFNNPSWLYVKQNGKIIRPVRKIVVTE